MKPVTWIWLRHLEAAGIAGTFCGRLDPALAAVDPARVARLAEALPRGAAVLTSPLSRCRLTLDRIRDEGGPSAQPEALDDFLEQSFGAWEGRSYADVPELSAWTIEDYAHRAPPGGESFATVCARVSDAIDRRNAEAAGSPIGTATFVVCTHAGVVRAALAHALALPPAKALAFAVDCGSITRITWIGSAGCRIEQVNVRP